MTPAVLLLAKQIIPILIVIAEMIFNRPKSGEDKKSWVMGILEAAIAGADAAFTGGAAATWSRIKPDVSKMIDGAAGIAFPHQGVIDRTDPRNV